jgi:general stress protein YciG
VAKKTGFALLTPEERAKLGRRGGKRAHKKGTAHQFTPEEAAEAGRKGGNATHAKRKKEDSDDARD